jgi:hypothetical protein
MQNPNVVEDFDKKYGINNRGNFAEYTRILTKSILDGNNNDTIIREF